MQQSIDGLVRYVLQGKPIPLQRARITKTRINGSYMYDPQKYEKKGIAFALKTQHGNNPLYDGALHLMITFFMPISKKQNGFHNKRPDLSNMIKFYEDVAQGILFSDDAKIAKITATKVYDKNPRVEFVLVQL
jgi:Holliday junction resolvase RusA-like endonuclease